MANINDNLFLWVKYLSIIITYLFLWAVPINNDHYVKNMYEYATTYLFIYILYLFLQRNHSLFGTVMSALTQGRVAGALPGRSNSLHINHTPNNPKVKPLHIII